MATDQNPSLPKIAYSVESKLKTIFFELMSWNRSFCLRNCLRISPSLFPSISIFLFLSLWHWHLIPWLIFSFRVLFPFPFPFIFPFISLWVFTFHVILTSQHFLIWCSFYWILLLTHFCSFSFCWASTFEMIGLILIQIHFKRFHLDFSTLEFSLTFCLSR